MPGERSHSTITAVMLEDEANRHQPAAYLDLPTGQRISMLDVLADLAAETGRTLPLTQLTWPM